YPILKPGANLDKKRVKRKRLTLLISVDWKESYSDSRPPTNSSCHVLSSSHFPAAANSACFGQVAGSWAANCDPALSKISRICSGVASAKAAKVAIPAP